MRYALTALVLAGASLGGCGTDRMLVQAMMPTPPKECDTVLGFKVDPLPTGKTTDSQLAVWMAKEGTVRQQEHAVSRVCAEYALRAAGAMKEKDAPPEAQKGVVAAKTVPPSKGAAADSNGFSTGGS